MIIDCEPIIEVATGINRVAIDIREIGALYVARLANGEDYSTTFDAKELVLFQPKKTVSEMLKSWEDGLQREYETAINAVETGIHPYWKAQRKVMDPVFKHYWTGKYEECDYILNEDGIKSFKNIAERLSKKLGKLTFHKLI